MSTLFTSESVSEGHPDKICDAISDSILDLYLSKDRTSRCAIETLATTDKVIIAGETSSQADISKLEIENIIRQTIRNIGYEQSGFDWRTVKIENLLHQQSPDIALGVDKQGAGDQGIMFGYAKNEFGYNTEYMPLPIYLSHHILKELANYRKQNPNCGLGPDAKGQITIEYADRYHALSIPKLVVSTQHSDNLSLQDVQEIVTKIINSSLPENLIPTKENILINPTGRFVIGGPDGDTGLTGRKIIVDTYGGYAPHGGGAFSGKDPTKVDRSAAYMLRYLAKNIVAANLADECLLQISYAIGVAEPLSIYIDTHHTAKVPENQILTYLKKHIDLTPSGIISHLQLQNPIYLPTSTYGHFGHAPLNNKHFSWEKLDLVKEFQNAF
ncbi:MAG: methionine adenosyltransferase [Alphaproteobacteria bacterium]|nr:methionine adenosyltransferase [Alphaproteobacteria bacterium]